MDSLETFRSLARESFQRQGSKEQAPSSPVHSMSSGQASRKRPKDTSGSEVSPHTVQSRPLSKRLTVGITGRRLALASAERSRVLRHACNGPNQMKKH